MRRPRRVSRDIWPASHSAPAALRAVRLSGHDRDRTPSRTTRRATTWFPPTPGLARQARSLRALAAPLAVSCTLPPRALPRSWRTGAYAMRRPPMLLRCSEALAQLLFAAFTRRALPPGNVARGDRCVWGTLPPRHHAGTNNLLIKALGATGRKAALVPRHYRIPAWSAGTLHRECDVPRRGRPAVTGRCASDRPPDEHHDGAYHRLVGAGHRDAGEAQVRRPREAPAALDRHQPQPRRHRHTAGANDRRDLAVRRRHGTVGGTEV